MTIFRSIDISASALTANRLRLDVISANIANANTTRSRFVDGRWQPYQRKMVELVPQSDNTFGNFLAAALNKGKSEPAGVKVSRIVEDSTPFKQVYDPGHPDADENGYVALPNVDLLKEMVDMMSATRSYEANVTAMNAAKAMILKALEIGR